MELKHIEVRGAREHNLRDVNVVLPRNQLIVFTGVSGSGKSSLAFDTLYAEGQRRYLESLSSYARQFIGQLPKPNVDYIAGLSPAVSISQKSTSSNPRSTVGTITEIYDFLRVLMARVGTGFCPNCQTAITSQTRDQIVAKIQSLSGAKEYLLLAPLIRGQKGEYRDLFESLRRQGYARARVDGQVILLSDPPQLGRQLRHTIEVVISKLSVADSSYSTIADAVNEALKLGENTLVLIAWDESNQTRSTESDESPSSMGKKARVAAAEELVMSSEYACPNCSISFTPPSPQLLSFNSPQGMCPVCEGLGRQFTFAPELLVPDEGKSIRRGAFEALGVWSDFSRWQRNQFVGVATILEKDLGLTASATLTTPWRSLPEEVQRVWLYGMGDRHVTFTWRGGAKPIKFGGTFAGIIHQLREQYRATESQIGRKRFEKYMETQLCHDCGGSRLNPQARNLKLRGLLEVPSASSSSTASTSIADSAVEKKTTKKRTEKLVEKAVANAVDKPVEKPAEKATKKPTKKRTTKATTADESLETAANLVTTTPSVMNAEQWLSLPALCDMPIDETLGFLKSLLLNDLERKIANEALREITSRLQFLLDVGLEYLSLNRPAPSLSGGEAQRIRLASQIGAGLVGVLYVLDEPSIGLHPRDNDRLIGSLKALRDQGNSLIVVEHDEDTMRAADLILDFGPGPGVRGGELVAQGSLQDLASASASITGQFLSGGMAIEVPTSRRPGNGQALRIVGARHNNLKNVTVDIPLGKLVCITGVSGSGKSSLIGDILVPLLRRQLHAGEEIAGAHDAIEGVEHLDKMIDIDQSPIGRTPRSNPATYVKVFDEIRNIFTNLPESKRRGYAPGRFSFNMSSGRCEACEGNGSNKLEMDILADLWITCQVCEGRRYNHETLQVLFKGKSIADILEMDVQQAMEHFQNVPRVADKLKTLHDVGMDYIKLGQPSPTLSGGEAQRIKLAKELSRRDTGRTLYLLDEPTTGLHFYDIRLLLKVLQDLVDRGNSVLVIEHNLDIIKAADWIIDLGPEGGAAGGQVIFTGTPDDILNCEASHTGKSLAKHLATPLVPRAVASTSNGKRKAVKAKSTAADKTGAETQSLTPVLKIKGATQHNLKHLSMELEHNTLNVFCGPSGSGKSSLAMDTIYAEGQRRYVESLSSYARQFVGQMAKPPVEHIEGLAPSIAIEQKSVAHNPRSTVGTVTEIYDYLRVLMARLGVAHCPDCDLPVSTQTSQEVAATLMKHTAGTKLILTAPLHWKASQAPNDLWQELRTAGQNRVRLDGKTYSLDEPPRLAINSQPDLQLVIDRVVVTPENRGRIAESVEQALSRGQGVMYAIEPDDSLDETLWSSVRHSQHLACQQCGRSLETLTPHSFSFNTPLGWCQSCEGLGTQSGADPNLVVDMGRSLSEGGLRLFPAGLQNIAFEMLTALAKGTGMSLNLPIEKFAGSVRRSLFYGTGERWYRIEGGKHCGLQFQWKGLMPALEEASRLSPAVRAAIGPLTDIACAECDGSRLTQVPAAVKFRGLTMGDIVRQSLGDLHQTLLSWTLDAREQQIAGEVLTQVRARIEFLIDVGLEYLSLSRAANSLSGGESQRIRLASQLGSGLCGVMYVLDEPTIGLHPRDNSRLLRALTKLRDLGNTLIVVEHDREIIAGSDVLCDFGPGAGRHGGQLVAQGTPKQIAASKTSVTGPYLSGKASIPIPSNRRQGTDKITLQGARAFTLRDVDVEFPLGMMTAVTGPSGSGKSTLINEILFPALQQHVMRSKNNFRKVEGLRLVDKVIRVDQSPLGQNPSSTPATYTGVFELIRMLYAQLPLSRARGFTQRQFSFNVPGGRCEKCEGYGQLRIEMHFLPDVWVQCDSCHGRRFTEDTLSVKYHDYSIYDILEMQVGKALEVLGNIPKIRRILQTLVDVGLDYVALGQSAPTLSGGEAQRVKLATELSRPDTGRTLYLLDEPTTGLHFSDVAKLLIVLHRLVDMGNTVLVIEHNLDVIKSADWVIDMGPEAGWSGGQVVVAGTPEQVVEHATRERAIAAGIESGMSSMCDAAIEGAVVPASKGRRATKGTRKAAATVAASAGQSTAIADRPIALAQSKPSVAVGESQMAMLRSHTGEALAEVLAQGPYAARAAFDPQAHFAKRDDDVELSQIGREALTPWQADGRGWHTGKSVDFKGGKIRWERDILNRVVDVIEASHAFFPVNWEDRSIVEVTGVTKSSNWFLHALTGNTWVVTLTFRVPRDDFTTDELMDVVQLPTFNEVPEIQAYGNRSRVRVEKVGAWLSLEIDVFKVSDIDKPEFWEWLDRAIKSYANQVA